MQFGFLMYSIMYSMVPSRCLFSSFRSHVSDMLSCVETKIHKLNYLKNLIYYICIVNFKSIKNIFNLPPPPPRNEQFAALTIASISNVVISPCHNEILSFRVGSTEFFINSRPAEI